MRLPSPAGGVLAAALLLLLLSSRALCRCQVPLVPLNSEPSEGLPALTFPVGSIMQLSCIPGYEPIPGKNTNITCLNNSTWTTIPTFCTPVMCPTPNITNGRFRHASAAEYPLSTYLYPQCNSGYMLVGTDAIACGIHKTWYPLPLPYCTKCNGLLLWYIAGTQKYVSHMCAHAVMCPTPNITNGGLQDGSAAEYPYNHRLIAFCNPGYIFEGPRRFRCGLNKTWEPYTPFCRKRRTHPVRLPTTVHPSQPTPTGEDETEEELPPYPAPSGPPDESGYWKIVATVLACVLAVSLLTSLIFIAEKVSSHERKPEPPSPLAPLAPLAPPAPPAPPEADYFADYNVISQGDTAFEELYYQQ